VENEIVSDETINHEYLPIDGLREFNQEALKLILGDHPSINEDRSFAFQALSGTGALRLGAAYLARYRPNSAVLISNPTWANHKAIFSDAGLVDVREYAYFNAETRGLDLQGMLKDIQDAPDGSIVVLHACAHNPTGVDPSFAQWKEICEVILKKCHFPFFDCAYQGFASDNVESDAQAVRYFASFCELFVAQSFAKNFGLYSERIGALSVVAAGKERAQAIHSQLCRLQRAAISNPPAFGARIVSSILRNPNQRKEWESSVKMMSMRIQAMRKSLYVLLGELKTPGVWNHIMDQIGMFSFTGLSGTLAHPMNWVLWTCFV
jgi:aspartate aminotransferase